MTDPLLYLLDHPDPNARMLAVRELQVRQGHDACGWLQSRFLREHNVELRFELRRSINELLSLKGGGPAVKSREARHALRIAMLGTDRDIQMRACHYAAVHQRLEFLPLMVRVEASYPDPSVSICCAYLMRFAPERWYSHLKQYLGHQNPFVVVAALDSLGYLGNGEAIRVLLDSTLHQAPLIAKVASENLLSIGIERLSYHCETLLPHCSESSRAALCDVLVATGHGMAAVILCRLLQDPIEFVRIHALRSLQAMSINGVQRAHELLMVLDCEAGDEFLPRMRLRDKPRRSLAERVLYADSFSQAVSLIQAESDVGEQASALLMLERHAAPWPEKRAFLLCYLQSEESRVRANALEALSCMCPEAELGLFTSFIDDDNNRMAGNAIMALSRHPDFHELYYDLAIARLRKMLKGSEVQSLTALYCIGSMQDESLLPDLQEALNDDRAAVAIKARRLIQNWALVSVNAFAAFQAYLQDEKLRSSNSIALPRIRAYELYLQSLNMGPIRYPDHFGSF